MEDRAFWTPLLLQPIPDFEGKNHGRRIHHCFPNLKYILCMSAQGEPVRQPKATVYISDQNLIERRDTEAFRQIIFDAFKEFRSGAVVPRKFADFGQAPHFRASCLNETGYDTTLDSMTELLAEEPAARKKNRLSEREWRLFLEFHPFEKLAMLRIDDVTLEINIVTTIDPETFRSSVRQKVLDLFFMTRRILAEERVVFTRPRLVFALEIDFDETLEPDGPCFEVVTQWMQDVSDLEHMAEGNADPSHITV